MAAAPRVSTALADLLAHNAPNPLPKDSPGFVELTKVAGTMFGALVRLYTLDPTADNLRLLKQVATQAMPGTAPLDASALADALRHCQEHAKFKPKQRRALRYRVRVRHADAPNADLRLTQLRTH